MGDYIPTIVIVLVLVVICIFAVRSYFRKLTRGCCGGEAEAVKKIKPVDEDKSHYPYGYRLSIDGMTCQNCAARVANAFNGADGFWATVDLKHHSAVVRTKQPVEEGTLRSMVAKAGYTATAVEKE